MRVIAQLTTANLHFGPKISIGLPKDFDVYEAVGIVQEINAFLNERFGAHEKADAGERIDVPRQAASGRRSADVSLAGNAAPKREPEAALPARAPEGHAEVNLGPADRLVPEGWPSSGTVTLAEICKAWGVSKSTYKRRMDAGKYPKPLEDVGTIAKLYSAPDVRDAFVAEMLALSERAAVRNGGLG